jgi:hypothetical protein
VTFALLVLLFVAERAHQWQSLLARDWTVTWKGEKVSRRAVLLTALVIGWGEGLGFYVQGERAFWALVFWVYAAHVILTAWLGLRRRGAPGTGRVAAIVAAAASLGVMLGAGSLDEHRPVSWIGFPGFRPMVDIPATAIVAFLVLTHALPCFAWSLRRLPPGARVRSAAIAIGCAALEWGIVAKSIWFPEGSLFPDLLDWWNLGKDGGLVAHPLWMAPFFAHVAIDAIRFWMPAESRP